MDSDFDEWYYVDFGKAETEGLIDIYSLGEGLWYFRLRSYVLPENNENSEERIGIYSDTVSTYIEIPKLPEPIQTSEEENGQSSSSNMGIMGEGSDGQNQSERVDLSPLRDRIRTMTEGYPGT